MMLDAFNNLALHFEILFLCSKEDTIFFRDLFSSPNSFPIVLSVV